MDDVESLIFFLGIIAFIFFIMTWYIYIIASWPPGRGVKAKTILGALPVISFIIILFVLRKMASFDVVDAWEYVGMYITLGFAWLYLGVFIMTSLFDISWRYDILGGDNNSALYAFTGGFLGLTLLYSAANIGDGPGWQCVVFTCAVGLIIWISLSLLTNRAARVFERITVERDTPCGIRFGFFLLACGLLIGRAAAGDWTSAPATIMEFGAGWPVLPLTALAIIIEKTYDRPLGIQFIDAERGIKGVSYGGRSSGDILASALIGSIYVIIAIVAILMLPPLPRNPIYS